MLSMTWIKLSPIQAAVGSIDSVLKCLHVDWISRGSAFCSITIFLQRQTCTCIVLDWLGVLGTRVWLSGITFTLMFDVFT